MSNPHILGDPEVIHESVPAAPQRDPRADRDADQAGDARRQAAFDAEFTWRGRKLEPFSISREVLFLQLRVAVGAPPIFAAARDGEGWLPDAMRILWLCHHGPDDWGPLRAEPQRLQEAIERWAEDHIARAERVALWGLTLRIWNASQENAHEPVSDTVTGKAPDAGN